MQRTYKCPCSVRALEAFVRDVAGLDIRQRRPSLNLRNFSTRPPLSIRHSPSQRLVPQIHPVTRSLDDVFVPFDASASRSSLAASLESVSDTALPLSLLETQEALEELGPIEEQEDSVEFEPEIVIHQDGLLNSIELEPTHLDPAIDAIFFPDLQFQQRTLQTSTHSQRLDILPPRAMTPKQRREERRMKRMSEPTEGHEQEKVPVATQKEPGKNALKRARRAAQALAENAALQEESAAMAAMIASATAPKPAKPKAEKKAAAWKAEKEAVAARKAAEEKEKAAAEATAQKERQRNKERWQIEKAALEGKFGEQSWNPRKRISPDALAGIRALHAKSPETFSTPVLAEHFKMPAEAIRRILKSKWQPSEEEAEERRLRWEKRGERKWTEMAEQGIKPPKKWRQRGVGKVGPGEVPSWKAQGKPGERWIESTDADRFVVAGDLVAEDMTPVREDNGIVDRIL